MVWQHVFGCTHLTLTFAMFYVQVERPIDCAPGACECWSMADPLLSQAGGLGRALSMQLVCCFLGLEDKLKTVETSGIQQIWSIKGRMMKTREFCLCFFLLLATCQACWSGI